MQKSDLKRRHTRVAAASLLGAAAMMGGAFALVPYYDAFCRAIGIGGDPQIAAENTTQVIDRPITVRFDANTDPQLPWKFTPSQPSVTTKLGETVTIHYKATNMGTETTTGTATFNVTPDKIGQYFNKIECFCFQEQILAPGQSAELGVTFYVDPALASDEHTEEVKTITLSYTFFRSKDGFPVEDSAQSKSVTPASPEAGDATN
ncbi:MAG: cytochrome c oxidase assembly protein [Proteobacteria bacterium]|nr:cytochrome c oxidase assembly protein [Pseudomonadota bacterium]